MPLLADLRALFARTGAAPAGDDRDPAPPDRARGAAVGGLRRGPAAHPATADHVLAGFQMRPKQNPAGRRHAQGVPRRRVVGLDRLRRPPVAGGLRRLPGRHAQGVRPGRLRRRLPALRASRPDTATRGPAAAPIAARGDGTPGGPGSDGEGLDPGATAPMFRMFRLRRTRGGYGRGPRTDRERRSCSRGTRGPVASSRVLTGSPLSGCLSATFGFPRPPLSLGG